MFLLLKNKPKEKSLKGQWLLLLASFYVTGMKCSPAMGLSLN